ncbi:MAG: hypothetical protein J0H91_19515 [Rhodospirillales bacterium]|nr:hypothetical protein [Rhodospirillales bacterium]
MPPIPTRLRSLLMLAGLAVAGPGLGLGLAGPPAAQAQLRAPTTPTEPVQPDQPV